MQQMQKVACCCVIVGFYLNAFATHVKMMPIEQHRTEAGDEPIRNPKLTIGLTFLLHCTQY